MTEAAREVHRSAESTRSTSIESRDSLVRVSEAARAATEAAWEGISTADLAQAVEYISRKMTDRNGCFWVAEESGVIVGSIMVGFYGHRHFPRRGAFECFYAR